ncbi:MAG: GNAT family protein [Actinomycetota bacterium]
MTVRLRGEVVTLRPFREDEFDAVLEREAGAEATEDARRNLRERLWRSGEWTEQELRLAVEAEGALVGDCQARISHWALPPGVCELGIGLFEEATGKGYGTDTLRTLSAYLFDEAEIHRVQLSTDVGNAAMRTAAEKAGFAFEGVLRGFWAQDDGTHDYAMYARTRADHHGGR